VKRRRQSAEERYWKASAAKDRATRRLLTTLQDSRLPKTMHEARQRSRILSFKDCEAHDVPLARAFKRILAGEARHENRGPQLRGANHELFAWLEARYPTLFASPFPRVTKILIAKIQAARKAAGAPEILDETLARAIRRKCQALRADNT
jgi:hypothetical protein